MSTTSEFILKKQVDKLLMLVQRQQAVIHALQEDIELTESVGCAFAFDLMSYTMELNQGPVGFWPVEYVARKWETAVKNAEEAP